MTRLLRVLSALGLTLAVCLATAQGGQGFGGGVGGRVGMSMEGEVATYNHILTPGDRGEWPLNMKEGETIVASASSTIFDPAIEVVDSDGKILAQNDDIQPGSQDAQVLYRFPKAGAYKILVKGYKSASGGQYVLKLRRFVAIDAPIGARTAASVGPSGTKWVRFPAKKGQTLVVTAQASSFSLSLQFLAPNGEEVDQDFDLSGTEHRIRATHRAEQDGDYYVRVGGASGAGSGFAVTVTVARIAPIALGASSGPRQLEPGAVEVWTLDAKAGDFVHISASDTGSEVWVSLAYMSPSSSNANRTEDEASKPFHPLPSDNKTPGVLNALLLQAGTYQITVSQASDVAVPYSLSVTPAAKPFTDRTTSSLVLGESGYWSFEAKKGEVLQLEGTSTQFDPTLDLYDGQGNKISSNDDGGSHRNAQMTVLIPQDGRFLLRMAAFGNGGSGAYALTKAPTLVRPLAVGAKGEGSIGSGGTAIWSLEGKAGQTIVLSVRSPEFNTEVRIVGPDGLEIAKNDDGGDGTDSLVSIRLPLNGTYTIWINGHQGSGRYIVRWIDLDR